MQNLTGKQLLSGGFALAVAAAGAAWAVKLDHISDLSSRLTACENANKLNYPSLLENINQASSALTAKLSTLTEIERLEKENQQLQVDLKQLQEQVTKANNHLDTERKKSEAEIAKITATHNSELSKLKESLDKAESALKDIFSENTPISLNQGEGVQLAGATVVVGFVEADINRVCLVNVNNESKQIKAGAYIPVKSFARECKVILESCQYGSSNPAKFRFVCAKG